MTRTLPKITVVIPTFNRVRQLRAALDAMERQSVDDDDLEIVVVSDGSTDGTAELLRGWSSRFEFRPVIQANSGPAGARNAGLEAARAPIVLFVDDDVIAAPQLVGAHLAAHDRHGGSLVVIGPMATPPDVELQPWVAWEQTMLYKQYEAMETGQWTATARQFYTGNASVPRDVALAAGGFDPRYRRAEDVEFARRLDRRGIDFTYEPAALGHHHAERSFGSWLANASAYGKNDVRMARAERSSAALHEVARHFHQRHPLTRWSTRLYIRAPWLRSIADPSLIAASRAASAVGARSIARACLSGLYNLAYYAGVAEELGSRDALSQVLRGATLSPSPTVGIVLEQSLGHVTHSANLHRLLARSGDVVPVFADLPFTPTGRLGTLPVVRSNWTVRAGLLARRELRRLQRAHRLRALFVHTQVPAVFLRRTLRRLPTVVSIDATPLQYDELGASYAHDRSADWIEHLKWRANRYALRHARRVVAWSEWAKAGAVDGYGVEPEKVVVIAPGVDPAMWRRSERPSASPDVVRILFVGGDLRRKGGDLLIRAFRNLRARPEGRPVELHLVTQSAVEPEPGIVVHAGLTPNSAELIALYHDCHVFALPTRGDCLPMVLSEAGAASLPLVSTNVGGIGEIVRDGETGLLVPVDDEAALTAALTRLVDDDRLRTEMGARAEALVAASFDAARNADRLAALLHEIAAPGVAP